MPYQPMELFDSKQRFLVFFSSSRQGGVPKLPHAAPSVFIVEFSSTYMSNTRVENVKILEGFGPCDQILILHTLASGEPTCFK